MAEMKTLNGFEIVDGKAREDIENLKNNIPEDMPTDDHINELIDAKLGVIENGTY